MSGEKTNNTIQAFWVALGSLAAFSVSLISTMILSRYFGKTDYGTYRQVLYVYTTFLTVFTLGLPKAYAYFLPRVEDVYVKSLIDKITRIFYLLGGVFSISLFIFSHQIAIVLKNTDLELALRLFSPVPFLMLPTMGIEGIYATYQKNKYIALYNVLTKSLILMCVALPVIFFRGTYKEAIMGFVAASFISFVLAIYMKSWCVKSKGKQATNIRYKEIFQFSLPLMIASIWGILIQSADKFFISRYFGTEVFAEFANGSLRLPFVGMIIGACSTVLMPLFSKKVYEKNDPQRDILPVWKSTFEKTIKITYPLVLFFMVFAPEVMSILYGTQYITSGVFFRIMLVVNFFTVISYFPILTAIGAIKFYRNVLMYGTISVIILDYLAIRIFNSPYVVTAVSVICTIGRIVVMLSFIARYFNIKLLQLVPVKLILTISIPSIAILLMIKSLLKYYFHISNMLVVILVAIGLYIIMYFVWCKMTNIEYKSIIRPLYTKFIKSDI